MLQTGILAENIQPAEPGGAVIDQPVNAVFGGNVDLDEFDRLAEVARSCGPRLIAIADDDTRAFGDEASNGFLADIIDRASDNDALSRQASAHLSPPHD
jgi:hypothetical protein